MYPLRKTELSDRPTHFSRYIDLVDGRDLHAMLAAYADWGKLLDLASLRNKWNFRYAPGKWSAAQAMQHVVDTERVMQYRALRLGRGDKTPLPGFDQDHFATHDRADQKKPDEILHEFHATRAASQALFSSFDHEAFLRMGMCSDIEISAGSLGFVIVGHQMNHLALFREKYLVDGIGPELFVRLDFTGP